MPIHATLNLAAALEYPLMIDIAPIAAVAQQGVEISSVEVTELPFLIRFRVRPPGV